MNILKQVQDDDVLLDVAESIESNKSIDVHCLSFLT